MYGCKTNITHPSKDANLGNFDQNHNCEWCRQLSASYKFDQNYFTFSPRIRYILQTVTCRSGKGRCDCFLTRAMEFRWINMMMIFMMMMSVTLMMILSDYPKVGRLDARKWPRVYLASNFPTFKFFHVNSPSFPRMFSKCPELPIVPLLKLFMKCEGKLYWIKTLKMPRNFATRLLSAMERGTG